MNKQIENLYQKYLACKSVSTDTRQIQPGSIFFALKGNNFNANEFAAQALQKGAKYVVIDEEKFFKNDNCILVDNVLVTLQKLARHHRDQLNIPVIGLTGSNGKTTSKEMVNAVLRKKYRTFATKGNLNNHIGVPLTILSIDEQVEIAVIEMGANHVGEIASLCEIANPTHGFITNIGKAHIGTFGGFENIIRGKSELYQHLITSRGQVFINSQNQILASMAKRFDNPLFYPASGDYYHAVLLSSDPYLKVKAENGSEIATSVVGAYNFENISIALCIAKYFGVDAALAHQAIAEYVPDNMRSQIVKKGSNTIILDAYNANPSSMQAAIENLASMKDAKKIAILGDMFELGDDTDKEHRSIVNQVAEKNFYATYLCGKLFYAIKEDKPNVMYFSEKEALLDALKKDAISNAVVLVKASRGIGLESVMEIL